ncbi:DUF4913 domain-containing protein [Nocardia sp. IFM 10818]
MSVNGVNGFDNDVERVRKQIAELMARRFSPSLRDVVNTIADRKFTELISTADGGNLARALDKEAGRIAAAKFKALREGKAGPAEKLAFDSLEAFFVDLVAPVYGCDLHSTTVKWCPSWAEHPAATVRLEAMWRSFEYHRLEGQPGIAKWLTGTADPIMAKLMAPDGPFVFCDAVKGHFYNGDETEDLPHTPLPPGSPYARKTAPQPAPVGGGGTDEN